MLAVVIGPNAIIYDLLADLDDDICRGCAEGCDECDPDEYPEGVWECSCDERGSCRNCVAGRQL